MNSPAGLAGGLMVCGTSSDAGKTTIVTGLCRLLARRGLRVAPFKAQNMALNSMVTTSGSEIGRAQAAQAEASGVEAEASMNPILLKPTSNHSSQVIVMGRAWQTLDARDYQQAKKDLWSVVTAELTGLRSRFDVVICEGAGSPAEINLLDNDLVNLRLAGHAQLPALLVGDIDRGGVFASMYGTVALLPPELSRWVRGFVINKFRGDASILRPAPEDLERRTGIPTLGVVPWIDGIDIDSEDSIALRRYPRGTSGHRGDAIDVAVIAFPHVSNFTDLDALAIEPDTRVRLVDTPDSLGDPDLLILPGTKSTLADLEWMRRTGLADAVIHLARADRPLPVILGICGGYQILGDRIEDAVESPEPKIVDGLGILPASTVFRPEKITARRQGTALGGAVSGYEIHHGRTTTRVPWIVLDGPPGEPEGAVANNGKVLGTSLHGVLEGDSFRQEFLSQVAKRRSRTRTPTGRSFAAARQARYDRIADAIEDHVDVQAIERLIKESSTREPAPTPP